MRKKLYIIYTDDDIQPKYGYYFELFSASKNFLLYLTVNNFKKWKHPSLFWSIRKYIRHKDPFGYWTKFRRRENENYGKKRKTN